ncbi:MAG TPA: HIT family protein [Spirillospora sp.]|nr:HIT family protein [Spirillospora sp.]
MTDCPLCPPRVVEEQTIVLENEHCLFIQQPQKILVGSGLIIPRQHRETVFDLTPEEWAATYELLHQAKALLDERYQPDGYNVGWNVGRTGGQEDFHAHLHVIPRFADEPLAGKGIRYWLKQPNNQRRE